MASTVNNGRPGAYSVFNNGNMTSNLDVRVDGCTPACITPQAALSGILGALRAGNSENGGAPISLLNAFEMLSIQPIGKSPTGNTTLNVGYSMIEVMKYFQQWGTNGKMTADDRTTSTVASAAAAWTAYTGLDFNTDLATVGTLVAGARTRPFGFLLRVTVPDTIFALELSDSAGTFVTRYKFVDDECREVYVFIPFRGLSTIVIDPTRPTLQQSYSKPFTASINDVNAPGAGTAGRISFRVFDFSGAQVVSNIDFECWTIYPTTDLLTWLNPNGGVLGQQLVNGPAPITGEFPNTLTI